MSRSVSYTGCRHQSALRIYLLVSAPPVQLPGRPAAFAYLAHFRQWTQRQVGSPRRICAPFRPQPSTRSAERGGLVIVEWGSAQAIQTVATGGGNLPRWV
jgi:hypothetical protein